MNKVIKDLVIRVMTSVIVPKQHMMNYEWGNQHFAEIYPGTKVTKLYLKRKISKKVHIKIYYHRVWMN